MYRTDLKTWCVKTSIKALKTGAQSLVALIGAAAFNILALPWGDYLGISAGAAVVCILHNISSFPDPSDHSVTLDAQPQWFTGQVAPSSGITFTNPGVTITNPDASPRPSQRASGHSIGAEPSEDFIAPTMALDSVPVDEPASANQTDLDEPSVFTPAPAPTTSANE